MRDSTLLNRLLDLPAAHRRGLDRPSSGDRPHLQLEPYGRGLLVWLPPVSQAPDGRVIFGVSDTGVGIALADQATIFEKFGQGRHAHIPKEKGTGLY